MCIRDGQILNFSCLRMMPLYIYTIISRSYHSNLYCGQKIVYSVAYTRTYFHLKNEHEQFETCPFRVVILLIFFKLVDWIDELCESKGQLSKIVQQKGTTVNSNGLICCNMHMTWMTTVNDFINRYSKFNVIIGWIQSRTSVLWGECSLYEIYIWHFWDEAQIRVERHGFQMMTDVTVPLWLENRPRR